MLKLIKKTGLNVGIAFAFLFATSMIVAQEKIIRSDNPEIVNESHTVRAPKSNPLTNSQIQMVSPVSFSIELLTAPTDPNNWTMTGSLSCDTGNNLCGISFDAEEYELDDNDKPNQDVLDAVNQHWLSTPHGQAIPNTNIIVYKRT